MASIAQIEANRANAQKSTGPRTAQGKAAVARNAVKHGLLAEQVVIQGEDPGQFEFYREAMLGELSPAGEVESMLAERAVGLAWRLRRAERLQSEVFGTLLADAAKAEHLKKMTRAVLPKAMRDGMDEAGQGQTELGQAVVRDYANCRVLDRLGLYEQRIERSLYKTMAELEKRRVTRELEEKGRGSRDTTNAQGLSNGGDGFTVHHRQASLDAATLDSKSEARNPKCETSSNNRKANDRNEIEAVCGSVKAEGLGDGSVAFEQEDHEMTEAGAVAAGWGDSVKQSQLAGDTPSREGVSERERRLG